MQIESSMPALPAFIDDQRQLPKFVQQEMVFVRDATGWEYKLLVDQCGSPEVSCVRWAHIIHGAWVNLFPRNSWVYLNFTLKMMTEVGPCRIL